MGVINTPMGLDISHVKATSQRPIIKLPHQLHGVTEDDYTTFNVPFEYFHRYIQDIDTIQEIDSIIIVKEEKYLEETIAWFKKSGHHVIFNKEKQALEKELKAIESKKNLTHLHKFFDDGPSQWIVLEYCDIIKKRGFYTAEVGYQRKGMNEKFWNRFLSNDIYDFALKEDFEYAYSSIDNAWGTDSKHDVETRKNEFKANFLDKFEAGASFLSLSY